MRIRRIINRLRRVPPEKAGLLREPISERLFGAKAAARLAIGLGFLLIGTFILSYRHGLLHSTPGDVLHEAGSPALLLLVFVAMVSAYLSCFLRSVFNSRRELIVLAMIVLVALAVARFLAELEVAHRERLGRVALFMPVPAVAICLGLLYWKREAIALSLLLSLLMGPILAARALTETAVIAPAMLSLGSIAGVLAAWNISGRTTLIKAGLVVGIVQGAVVLGFELLFVSDPRIAFAERNWLWGIAGGVFVGLLCTVIVPMLEYFFGVATDISLLELQNQSHPLRRQLVLRAPGTNQHSQAVGILAEAAAEAIGANPVLARVGSHFHDIGKINKPEYFVENESGRGSMHEGLTIPMSTTLILSHVKDGVELAKAYGLPVPIIDIIEQHHGTTLVEYFYNLSKSQPGGSDELGEEFFRYPGPKPRTKEAAIILLADTIEAVFRTLSAPSAARIDSLCHEIIMKRLRDGQLDESGLDFADLHKIRRAFVRELSSMFHSRVKYPGSSQEEANSPPTLS